MKSEYLSASVIIIMNKEGRIFNPRTGRLDHSSAFSFTKHVYVNSKKAQTAIDCHNLEDASPRTVTFAGKVLL